LTSILGDCFSLPLGDIYLFIYGLLIYLFIVEELMTRTDCGSNFQCSQILGSLSQHLGGTGFSSSLEVKQIHAVCSS
jgi:hypothetical protein